MNCPLTADSCKARKLRIIIFQKGVVEMPRRSRTDAKRCKLEIMRLLLEREPSAEDFDRIEGEFRIEAALNVAGLAEAMLLAREQEIADRIALAPQRLNHAFRLVRRHDGVLFPLEEDDRLREPIRVMERRALAIARFLLRIRSDQPVEIARLELVGVARERSDVAHAVIAGPALKEVAEGQCRQGRVAAGAAAADDASLAVDPPLRRQEPRAGDAIVDVDHAPIQLQTVAVGAAEAGASAVVHVEHRDAAARPILNAQIERARCGGRRSAVALDEKRRLLLRPRHIVWIARRIEQAEGCFSA